VSGFAWEFDPIVSEHLLGWMVGSVAWAEVSIRVRGRAISSLGAGVAE
jgi:hypothetical protein